MIRRLKKNSIDTNSEISGFLGEGTTLNGEIRFKNAFRIDGKVIGKIISEDMLIVGSRGEVEAEVDVGVLSVSGLIRGDVRAREKLEIHNGGKICGTITLDKPNFIVEEGGIFEGKVDMRSSNEGAAKDPVA
ncbi:MAG: polymer-forming cytoskeletal protein [Acidobacteriota bacterium]